MFLERHKILELNSLLDQLLGLKDADFSKFLNNSDSKEIHKPFINCLVAFTNICEIDEITTGLHEKVLKFLLRLCPTFNSKYAIKKRKSDSEASTVLKSVFCPKKFVETLFESDPLGLLVYLYCTWNPSEFIDIIRDELIPSSLIKQISKLSLEAVDDKSRAFFQWLCKNSFHGALNNSERDNIMKRFEYESDDDYFEDEDESLGTETKPEKSIDPIQAILLETYISNPSLFTRTSAVRKLPERLKLQTSTKLSHEQLEGWALMLERNPKKSNVIQDYIIWRNSKK